MDGPMPRSAKNQLDSRLRRVWSSVAPHAEAVWEHLKHNWTDALLGLGFIAVILLSAYILLHG